jgi:hypothetical protein
MAPPKCPARVKSGTVSPKVAHFGDTVKQAKLKWSIPLSRREQGRAERELGGSRGGDEGEPRESKAVID